MIDSVESTSAHSWLLRPSFDSIDSLPGAMDSSTQPEATSSQPRPEAIQSDAEQDALAKRVLRKIDWRLIPLMFITYNLNFMDKTILSSASVFGLREDNVRTLNLVQDLT